jgi:hypothetical protein
MSEIKQELTGKVETTLRILSARKLEAKPLGVMADSLGAMKLEVLESRPFAKDPLRHWPLGESLLAEERRKRVCTYSAESDNGEGLGD